MSMNKVAILVPVLRRPQNIHRLVLSIHISTRESYEIVFIVSPGDVEEIKELENQGHPYIVMDRSYENNGDYARKMNKAFNEVEAEWYFLGADDLEFHPEWFELAMDTYDTTGACVIGTNDLGNPAVRAGQHATHSLVLGEYGRECGTIDESGKILHEGYKHNFVDSEFVETAKWRDAWAFAKDSWVEHLHPDWKKGKIDSTYQVGKSGWNADRQYFEMRKRLWT